MEVYASLAQQEYESIHKRQKEGIAVMPMKDGKKVSKSPGAPWEDQK